MRQNTEKTSLVRRFQLLYCITEMILADTFLKSGKEYAHVCEHADNDTDGKPAGTGW
jgi:hypothetical protein